MVLEIILDPRKAESFSHVLLLSFIYTIFASFVATIVFPQQASVAAIAVITLLFLPFFQGMFEKEEAKENSFTDKKENKNIFARHESMIKLFSAFFLGIVFASSFVYIFLPLRDAFSLQTSVLQGFATKDDAFMKIFLNNTQVMFLMFVFSILMGAGAIFILTWNASVVAVYAGLFVQSLTGPPQVSYLLGVPAALGSIAVHGIPEILAYFLAGLAGGILSYGIAKEKIMSREFRQIFIDALIYIGMAETLILIAGFLEVVL